VTAEAHWVGVQVDVVPQAEHFWVHVLVHAVWALEHWFLQPWLEHAALQLARVAAQALPQSLACSRQSGHVAGPSPSVEPSPPSSTFV